MNARKLLSAAFALIASCTAASAQTQVGSGTLHWQVSVDNGASWQSGVVDAPTSQQEVRVRALAAWSADAGYAFKMSRFDAVWRAAEGGTGLNDHVVRAAIPEPLRSQGQTLASKRFGRELTLDDARDTLPAGSGARWVIPNQLAETFGQPFSSSNPLVIFEYAISLDGSLGERTADALFSPLSPNPAHLFSTMTNASGAQNYPSVTHFTATLRVIPAPGGVCAMAIGVMLATGRRRVFLR